MKKYRLELKNRIGIVGKTDNEGKGGAFDESFR